MSDRIPLRRVVAVLSIVACLSVMTAMTMTAGDALVAFNTKSLKYHCLICEWAHKCTRNCVTITRTEAIKRHGIACKVCGGTCKKGSDSSNEESNQ